MLTLFLMRWLLSNSVDVIMIMDKLYTFFMS
jgi:hypothetical protein